MLLTFGTSTATSLIALGLISLIACRKSIRVISTKPATSLSDGLFSSPNFLRKAFKPVNKAKKFTNTALRTKI